MEIRTLSTFIKVAEEQSLSKAAKQLGYAQSTVTMQMQQLEQELGVPLYERVGKQIRITQEGQKLLSYAVHIVKTSQEALQIGKGEQKAVTGTLRLGAADPIDGAWFSETLHRYRRENPEVCIRVRSGDTQTLLGLLLHNEIDLMMTVDHRLHDPALVHAEDREESVHFVAAPDHPLAAGFRELTLEEIFSHTVIRGGMEAVYERDLEAAAAEAGILPADELEIEDKQLALDLVLYGDGITLMPDSRAQRLVDSKRLTRLNYRLPGPGLWRQVLYHKNKWRTGAMDAWIKMLEEKR